jgi:hypothetical protein
MGKTARSSRSRATFVSDLDLLEIRRQLSTIRAKHLHDRQIVRLLNRRLAKLYYLQKPVSKAHERNLIKEIDQTLDKVSSLMINNSPK